ncbi:MAG: GNAT family N-acetyltransferase [Archangiaceae bacterium]|nr:GNAT family N-acetyltransferase [Archangiaceae bacterium]
MISSRALSLPHDELAACELLNRCEDAGRFQESFSYWQPGDLARKLGPSAPQGTVWVDGAGRVCGVLLLLGPADDLRAWYRVAPELGAGGLSREVVRHAAAEAARLGARLDSRARSWDQERLDALEGEGFVKVRTYAQLARRLDRPSNPALLQHAQVVEARAVPPQELRELFEACWKQAWNFGEGASRAFVETLDTEHPELQLVALDEQQVPAAFCTCRLDARDNARLATPECWVETLGTRPGRRSLLLGPALFAALLERAKGAGARVVKFFVDTQNTRLVDHLRRTGAELESELHVLQLEGAGVGRS